LKNPHLKRLLCDAARLEAIFLLEQKMELARLLHFAFLHLKRLIKTKKAIQGLFYTLT
jgi:hypothetical protein